MSKKTLGMLLAGCALAISCSASAAQLGPWFKAASSYNALWEHCTWKQYLYNDQGQVIGYGKNVKKTFGFLRGCPKP
ncbi:hypothetical protein [Pragia fontium]|uniref:Uncharacterized protein n=2 Tax=Pragia fontium TaxID=82985 RepID=A0AAJ5BG95_9GAMM|nr:hypothetical protein [Pragia fontium]AKJ41677.1 hypothetical protein QQ39_05930 [Pragia fontium]SFC33177.1 hypothetical protein SAMN02745723_10297 [Pragia fontium DSM 5563 = ATCC 49100]SUB81906.1 Uncharacterised protein [Pragia fontium]VEJ54479.1 Uncharacterised protein [Pragia fontium]GKX62238.1 hypothetical protein SOASR032_08070 [Pragia fontium]